LFIRKSESKISFPLHTASKIILGIDPGTLVMGYSLIAISGKDAKLLEMGILKLSARKDAYERLQLIHRKVHELILHFTPTDFAIEAPFFGKNVQSMLKLGRAQGVAIATAMQAGIPVTEYSPKKVKQSITGNGNADKEQVWKMLKHLLQLDQEMKKFDASDALAVAVCHHFQNGNRMQKSVSKATGWAAFVKQNPERIKTK
jgi:crossover junction endodeoxyribonuclease RuvC